MGQEANGEIARGRDLENHPADRIKDQNDPHSRTCQNICNWQSRAIEDRRMSLVT